MQRQTEKPRFYESLKQEGQEVEIIFVSADKSEADFKDAVVICECNSQGSLIVRCKKRLESRSKPSVSS